MKCPICGGEMEQGFLQGGNRVAWTRRVHKISLLPERGEILLENNMLSQVVLRADICKRCKQIVVDYSDKEIREG